MHNLVNNYKSVWLSCKSEIVDPRIVTTRDLFESDVIIGVDKYGLSHVVKFRYGLISK